VFKDTRALAAGAIALADALLQGNSPNVPGARVDDETYDTGLRVVTSFLLEPVNVTQDNYFEILIESGFYSESDLD